jgi:hypothetical protein
MTACFLHQLQRAGDMVHIISHPLTLDATRFMVFLQEQLSLFCVLRQKTFIFFHVRKTELLSAYWHSFSYMEKYYIFFCIFFT